MFAKRLYLAVWRDSGAPGGEVGRRPARQNSTPSADALI